MLTVFVALSDDAIHLAQLATRAGSVVRSCEAEANTLGEHAAGKEAARHQSQPSQPVLLRDIFSPKRGRDEWSGAGKKRALDRLDRLQEVANLALEDREARGGASWGCADIGAGACVYGIFVVNTCTSDRQSDWVGSRCVHSSGWGLVAGALVSLPAKGLPGY